MKILLSILSALIFISCKNTNDYTKENYAKNNVELAWDTLNMEYAIQMAPMPINCIFQEYPNKTGHTAADKNDALKTPAQLHPSFYGCFDWHSSVHGHWMLVRILNKFPDIAISDSIKQKLAKSLTKNNIRVETAYFEENISGAIFERTYGWAWLLKLDQELAMSQDSIINNLYKNLQPLTQKIRSLWITFLEKQSYPNKNGVHGNTAFALSLAYDWADFHKDSLFKHAIKNKAINFYADMKNYPAHLEPDGADFFSPSLYIADLMTRVLDSVKFNKWFKDFFNNDGIENICKLPVVSDRNDYQIVHLDGLMFSKVANMRRIIPYIADKEICIKFQNAQKELLETGLKHLKASNYGGEHWLASFAILALSGY